MNLLRVLLDAAPAADRESDWALFDAGGRVLRQGRARPDAWPAADAREAIVTAAVGRVVTLALPPLPPQRVAAAAAFALEDQLAGAPEDSHAAFSAQSSNGDVRAVVIADSWMRALATASARLGGALAARCARERLGACARVRLVLVRRCDRSCGLCSHRSRHDHRGRTGAPSLDTRGTNLCAFRGIAEAKSRSRRHRWGRCGAVGRWQTTKRRRVCGGVAVALACRGDIDVCRSGRSANGPLRYDAESSGNPRPSPFSVRRCGSLARHSRCSFLRTPVPGCGCAGNRTRYRAK